jgi:hypothetical protein
MPIRWIGGVLPKTMERDAGIGYCYARRESNLKHVRCESKTTHQAERGARANHELRSVTIESRHHPAKLSALHPRFNVPTIHNLMRM